MAFGFGSGPNQVAKCHHTITFLPDVYARIRELRGLPSGNDARTSEHANGYGPMDVIRCSLFYRDKHTDSMRSWRAYGSTSTESLWQDGTMERDRIVMELFGILGIINTVCCTRLLER